MEKLKKHKRIVAALVIITATIITELLFNYHALVEGYEPMDIGDHIEFTKLAEEPGYLISYESKSGIYVKQIKLVGDYSAACEYEIDVVKINEFGKSNAVISYTDTTSTWFPDYYTNINAKVKSLEIRIPQNGIGQIKEAYLINSFEVNKYRVLFVFAALILMYCALFERLFVKKTECFFAVFVTIFGLLIILYGQPVPMGLDSTVHFGNVYSAACGKKVEWTTAARAIADGTTPQCNTKAEFAQLRHAMDKAGQQILYTETKDSGVIPYSYASYVPIILFLKLGMLMHLPFTWLYMLGKVGNLLSYVVLVFLAIRMAGRQKMLLAFVSMMPTCVYLASTYSYDAFIIACVELGCVLWCNEMLDSEGLIHKGSIIAMAFLFTVGCFSKAVYVPLVLLVLIIPGICGTKRTRRIMWMGILIVFVLAMMTFVLPFLTNVVARNIAYGGDSRGGDTSAVRQAISMVKHPLASIRLMLASIFQWDSFRVNGTATAVNYYIGRNMLLSYGTLNILPEAWDAILFSVFIVLFFHQGHTEKAERQMDQWQKIYGIIVLFITIGMIWLAMYLSFSEVGERTIKGVQPRYFIPLVYLGAILFQSDKIVLKASQDRIAKVMMTSLNVIWMFAVYEMLLSSRLF